MYLWRLAVGRFHGGSMPYRVIKEIMVMGCTAGGALIGWSAGHSLSFPTADVILAFVGMALCGAFAEICMTRR
jgi:hypothetical protein